MVMAPITSRCRSKGFVRRVAPGSIAPNCPQCRSALSQSTPPIPLLTMDPMIAWRCEMQAALIQCSP